jgi:hypothetical protein
MGRLDGALVAAVNLYVKTVPQISQGHGRTTFAATRSGHTKRDLVISGEPGEQG